MKNIVKSKKFGKIWLSCALFCSQLTCGMATENQNQNSLKDIAAAAKEEKLKKLENYLNDKGFNRGKVRRDLKQLGIKSAGELEERSGKLPWSEKRRIFREEVSMFASLGEVVKKVSEWCQSKDADKCRELSNEQNSLSSDDRDVRDGIYWLDAMGWMGDWNGAETSEEHYLKEECLSLRGELEDFL